MEEEEEEEEEGATTTKKKTKKRSEGGAAEAAEKVDEAGEAGDVSAVAGAPSAKRQRLSRAGAKSDEGVRGTNEGGGAEITDSSCEGQQKQQRVARDGPQGERLLGALVSKPGHKGECAGEIIKVFLTEGGDGHLGCRVRWVRVNMRERCRSGAGV